MAYRGIINKDDLLRIMRKNREESINREIEKINEEIVKNALKGYYYIRINEVARDFYDEIKTRIEKEGYKVTSDYGIDMVIGWEG